MDMRALIAKLTSLEEESKKDKDYDHDSLDDKDVDYIEKNSKEEDDDEHEPSEDDVDSRDVKESVESSEEDDEDNEKELEECGGGEITTIPAQHGMEQQDNVSMTINMSGSGKGGIHDILDVIRNIEKGNPSRMGSDNILPVGDKELNKDATMIIGNDQSDRLEDDFSNSPDVKYASLKHITNPPSNDMHSPMNKQGRAMSPMLDKTESLKAKLESLYSFIKGK